jgi:hypothetical protein
MADSPDVGDIVRRAMQANARFYKGWVDLTLEYFRGIAEIFSGEPARTGAEAAEPAAGVLVLEAEEGTAARGAFLVTNDLGRTLTCELVASEFADRGGGRVPAQVQFEPPRLELAPGEQRVVRVTIPIAAELNAGVAYAGEFSIEGLDGFSVPVVLRRTHRVDESPGARKQPPMPQPGGSAKHTPAGQVAAATSSLAAGGKPAAKRAGAKRASPGKRIARQKE